MAWWIGILKAIPDLIALFRELTAFLKETFGDNPAKFIRDSHEVFRDINNAKTIEEKQNALNKLNDLYKRLG